jgi:hypothetical protein
MKAIAAALLLVTASAAHAQSIEPTGHWKGTIEIPNNPVDFEMDLARDARGVLVGTLSAAAEHLTVPLLKVTLEGSTLAFYGRTDQQFHADVLPSGKALSGTTTLAGYTLPFSMGRTGDAKIEPAPTSPAVTRDVVGTWIGTLSADGKSLRLRVTIANQPDGTALAQATSLDEGGLTLPLVISQSGRQLKIETRGLALSYVATLNDDATELSGTWTHGPTSLPLTLGRATIESAR